MRPILIMPRPKVNEAAMADARRLNDLDAKRGAVELNEEGAVIDDLEERRTRWRRWCGLSEVIVMKSAEPSVPRPRKLEPPASLTNCENLIEMLLRRRRLSLPVRVRANSKGLLELGHPATVPASAAHINAVAWLLWEASWRGMSTARQVAELPLHVQTLTVKWWTSMPATLRFGPAEYLLRALSEGAANVDRFWQSVVGRMRRYGFYFVDPRLVSIEFRARGQSRRRRSADD